MDVHIRGVLSQELIHVTDKSILLHKAHHFEEDTQWQVEMNQSHPGERQI